MSGIAAAERRLHPATLIGTTLKTIPQAVGGMAAYGAFIAEAGILRVLMFAAAGAAVAAAIGFLHWWRFRYGVGEAEFVIESGIFHRQRRVIPFDRVQDIAIEQGLLARAFGTAKVRIETGGSASDEGELDSISLADAQAMRDVIRTRSSAVASRGEAAEPVLFAMSLGRVLTAGLFNFSLVFLAAIFALFQYVEPWLGLVWSKPERLLGRAEKAAGGFTWELGLLLGALLIALGVASGIARTLSRDYGFRLTRAPAGLRRRRGLFTLSEAVIPIGRVQVAAIESGLFERRFGWFRLQLQTLGGETSQGGRQTAAPFARWQEIEPILDEVSLQLPAPDAPFVRSPRRAIVRRTLVPLLLAITAAGVGVFATADAFIPAAVLAAIALLFGLAWRRHSFLLDGGSLFVKAGLLTRRLWALPLDKAQTISVAQSALQRRLGLANVLVDTAGASGRAPRVLDLDEADAHALADRLLTLFKASRAPLRLHGSASGTERPGAGEV